MRTRGNAPAVLVVVVAVSASVGGGTAPVRAASPPAGPQISHGVAVSPVASSRDLRTLPQVGPATSRLFPAPLSPDLQQRYFGLPSFQAPTETAPGPLLPSPPPIVSFKGLDKATWGAGWPPDTVGDVGPNHFIQAVNTSIGIFNKTGTRLAAFTFNAFWPDTTSTLCDNSNSGDPTVIYDPIADRWIIADFAFAGDGSTPPFYECIAVSQTSDPVAGGWFFYRIRTDDVAHPWFADYPKMGIWPDGLYMTANMFDSTGAFKEVRVWAFNRGDLEAGLAVRNVVFDFGSTAYASLLPSNMRTAAGTPPVGRENLLISESRTLYAFHVFKFHADYSGSGSSFTGPTNVSQTTYTTAPATVTSPGNALDSLQDRLMMQAQYSNIGGAESVWVNHTVNTGSIASGARVGIQWAQINVTGGTVAPTPVQQQIYGDTISTGLHRWMGSLAVDKNGDMALGYSVSSATQNPDIRYAGRLVTDPLNTLPQTETSMLNGVTLGTQSGSCGATCVRWGDYSAMSLDPDGCTFWYTQEYYETTGLNWQTRIGSFRYPSCTVVTLSTALSVAPASGTYGGTTTLSATLAQGSTGVAGQTVSFSLNGVGVGSTITDATGTASVNGIGLGAFTAGSYATAVGATYAGNGVYGGSSGSNSLAVNKAAATLTIVPTSLHRNYDGSPKSVTVTASPPGLSGVSVTYNGSAVAPKNVGSYAVVASLANVNYAAPNVTGTLKIADKTPPNTKLISGPSGRKKSRRAAFRFRSTEAGSRFQCKLDRKAWRACRSPASYKKLKVGRHTFRVRAIDRAGNVDRTPATRSWRVRR